MDADMRASLLQPHAQQHMQMDDNAVAAAAAAAASPHSPHAAVAVLGSTEPDFDAPFPGGEWETKNHKVFMPTLTRGELDQLESHAPHHLWQTQSLLLVLLLSSLFTLLATYGVLRLISVFESADNLFLGSRTSLNSRAKYFGIPAVASIVLNLLVYFGFRSVWKKKTWRVLREVAGVGAMLRAIKRAVMRQGQEDGDAERKKMTQQSTAAAPAASATDDDGVREGASVPVPAVGYTSLAGSNDRFSHSVSLGSTPMQLSSGSGGAAEYLRFAAADNGQLHRHHQAETEQDMSRKALQQLALSYHSGAAPPTPTEQKDDDTAAPAGAIKLGTLGFGSYAPPSTGGYNQPSPPSATAAPLFPVPLLADNARTYAHAFDPPPASHPYFYCTANLLHPSDIALLRQHPSWSHHMWALVYTYYLFELIPFVLFGIATAVFAEPDMKSWQLSGYLTLCTFLTTQAVKMLVMVPRACFGDRVSSSSWGTQFSLNLFVSLLAVLSPLVIFCAHSFVIIIGGLDTESESDELNALDALFDSVLQSYLLCVASDEAFLTLQAFIRWKEINKQKAAKAASNAAAEDDGAPAPDVFTSVLTKAKSSFLSYSLEGELKLFLYTILFPICTSNINPDVLLVSIPCVVVVWLGFKIRYELFAPLLNEPEETEQLQGRDVRRGSDLLAFGSMSSVLYSATQWVCLGGAIVLILLNINELISFIRPTTAASSTATDMPFSSSGVDLASSGMFGFEESLQSGNQTLRMQAPSTRRLLELTASAEAAAASFPTPWASLVSAASTYQQKRRREPIAETYIDGSGRLRLSFAHSSLRLWSSSVADSSSSLSASKGDSSSSGGFSSSSGSVWSSPLMIWSYLLGVVWIARSLYFLCTHEVKAVRTLPFQSGDDQTHLPRHMRLAAAAHQYGSGNADAAAGVTRRSPVGPLEEYVLMELNPDKISAVARSLSRTRCPRFFMLFWWAILQGAMLSVAAVIFVFAIGIYMLLQYSCTSQCIAGTTQQLCQASCQEASLLMFTMEAGFILAPAPFLAAMALSSWVGSPILHWINRYFLGIDRPYPNKFFASPCFIWWRRARIARSQWMRTRLRQKELKRLHGDRWEEFEKQEQLADEQAANPGGAAAVAEHIGAHMAAEHMQSQVAL